MSLLEVRVLGELDVAGAAGSIPLPPSRKTRMLLAYLALTGREERRERLSGLLWDVADDARAALRWSLTKLRHVVNHDGVERLRADRNHVALDCTTIVVDLMRVRAALRPGVDALSTAELEELAAAFRGELLDGLYLPDFDEIEAWLESARAEARALHIRILRALVQRHAARPDVAMRFARAWLQASAGATDEAAQAIDELAKRLGAEPALPPVPAPPQPEPARPAPASPSFVVRERELAELQALADLVRVQATARVVVVMGAPGLGKTHLLQELVRREAGRAAVIEGACHEAERRRSYAPFVDALGRMGQVDPARPGDAQGDVLDALRTGATSSTTDTEAVLAAWATLVRRAATTRPMALVVLDDAHLLDESSSELLHHVARAAAGVPALFVLGCRTPDMAANAALTRCLRGLERHGLTTTLTLAPLAPDEVVRLVSTLVPHAAADVIAERAAGHPLYALELARARPGEIPPSLAAAITERLAALAPEAQALVRWAAILTRAPLAWLEAVSAAEVTDFVAAAEEALRYGFVHIVSDGAGKRVEVVHDLVREVIDQGLSPVRRAAMHRAVAGHLGTMRTTAELAPVMAHHAARADNPGLAVRACLEAAELSARWRGTHEAEALVALGLEHAAALAAPERQEREIELLQILVRVRRPADIEALTTRLRALGTEAMELGSANHAQLAFSTMGYLRWDHDDPWMARRGLDQILAMRSDIDTAGRALVLASSAMCLALLEQELPRADALLVESDVISRALPRPPLESPMARAVLHRHRGDEDKARVAFDEARQLARAVGDRPAEARALELAMLFELEHGRSDDARALAHALVELAARIREGGEGPLARAVLALTGPVALVAGEIAAPLAELRRLDDARRTAIVLNRLAAIELDADAIDRAEEHATEALAHALRVRRPSEAVIALALRMRVASARGDDTAYAEAEARLAELEARHNLTAEARAHVRRAAGHDHI